MTPTKPHEVAQAMLFPALATAVAVAGWAGLRPAAPTPIEVWLPEAATVSYVQLGDEILSLQQGPIAAYGSSVPPDIALGTELGDQLWRVELNQVANRPGGLDRVQAITYVVGEAITLVGVDMSFGTVATEPVPVISDALMAGGEWSDEVDVVLRDEISSAGRVPTTSILTASPQQTGCSLSTIAFRFEGRSLELQTTWCQGRGVVDYAFGMVGRQEEARAADRPEPPSGEAAQSDLWPQGAVWGRAGAIRLDALQGSTSIRLDAPSMVATRSDGLIMHAVDDSVVAIEPHPADADQVTGTVLWRVATAGPVAGLAVGGEWVFVADVSGHLMGVSPAGGIQWRERLPDAATALSATDGLVVAHTHDGSLTALHDETGQVAWSTQLGTLSGPQALTAHEDVVVATTLTQVQAFNASDGAELFTWSGMTPAAAATNHGQIAVADAGLGILLADRSGNLLWRRGNDVSADRLIITPTGVVAVGDLGAVAFDTAGQRRWQRDGNFVIALEAAAGATVIAGPETTELIGPDGDTLGVWGGIRFDAAAVTPVGIYAAEVLR